MDLFPPCCPKQLLKSECNLCTSYNYIPVIMLLFWHSKLRNRQTGGYALLLTVLLSAASGSSDASRAGPRSMILPFIWGQKASANTAVSVPIWLSTLSLPHSLTCGFTIVSHVVNQQRTNLGSSLKHIRGSSSRFYTYCHLLVKKKKTQRH